MLSKSTARFKFCGQIIMPKRGKELVKRGVAKFDQKKKNISINLGIKDKNNSVFVTAFDSEKDVIKTYDKDGNPIDIPWEDRFDKDILAMVPSYKLFTVNLGEKKEFLAAYDAIEYLADALIGYVGNIIVTGTYRLQPARNGNGVFESFNLEHVYEAKEDDKPQFTLSADLYYNRDSYDTTDLKATGKSLLNAYIPMYVSKEEGTKLFPFQCVFNESCYNRDNESHVKKYEYKLKYVKTNSKKMQHVMWELRILRGAEEVSFDESCLTSAQREQIENGDRTLDDFRPRGSIYGEAVSEFRLFAPILRGEFANGMVDTDWTTREFEEELYVAPVVKDIEEAVAAKQPVSAANDDDDDELF